MKENRVKIYNKDKTLRYKTVSTFDIFQELVFLTDIIKSDDRLR